MALVLAAAVALWGFGHLIKAPLNARLLMLALLYVGVLSIQIALPEGNPLRDAVGGSPGEWLVLGGMITLFWAYTRGLKALKGRALTERTGKTAAASQSDTELERNARHIVLREIGGVGQKRLKEARVLVIGAGGLGSPVLQYLGAAGVGTLGVIDDDVVENSNLQRQIIHTDARIGMPKVFSAAAAIKDQNPFVDVRPYNRRLTSDIAKDLFEDYDVVLDGTDDPVTRYIVNDAAVAARIPLVSAAISQWEGQISVFDPSRGAPCYRCVFPEQAAPGLAPSCAEGGVLGPLPGVVGAMMAVETIKLITGAGETLLGRMMIYDALWSETRTIKVAKRPDCPTCGVAR